MRLKCIWCEQEQQWQRSCAEQSIPDICHECSKYAWLAQSISLAIKTTISKIKDKKKAFEISKTIESTFEEIVKDEQTVDDWLDYNKRMECKHVL